jgi:methyl-accepting chemotaxis protein
MLIAGPGGLSGFVSVALMAHIANTGDKVFVREIPAMETIDHARIALGESLLAVSRAAALPSGPARGALGDTFERQHARLALCVAAVQHGVTEEDGTPAMPFAGLTVEAGPLAGRTYGDLWRAWYPDKPMSAPGESIARLAGNAGALLRTYAHSARSALKDSERRSALPDVDKAHGNLDSALELIGQSERKALDSSVAATAWRQRMLQTAFAIGCGFALVYAAVLATFFSRGLSKSVQSVMGVATAMSAGDLTRRASVATSDEMADFARTFNDMSDRLSGMVNKVRSASEQVRASAEIVATTSQDAATGANQQQSGAAELTTQMADVSEQMESVASQMEQMASGVTQASATIDSQSQFVEHVSSTMEELSSSVAVVEQIARKAKDQGSATIAEAQRGRDAVDAAATSMDAISETIGKLASVIDGLGARSSHIGEIVDTISGIASQTNLLALNAAIEAARAGEHGRGFSVVADEVRKLAERTAAATSEIGELVAGIQAEARAAVETSEVGVDRVKRGSEVTGNVRSALNAMGLAVHDTVEGIDRILASTSEQSRAADQVQGSIKELAKMSRQMALGMTEQSTAAQNVTGLIAKAASATQTASGAVQQISSVADAAAGNAHLLAMAAQDMSRYAGALRELMQSFVISEEA